MQPLYFSINMMEEGKERRGHGGERRSSKMEDDRMRD